MIFGNGVSTEKPNFEMASTKSERQHEDCLCGTITMRDWVIQKLILIPHNKN